MPLLSQTRVSGMCKSQLYFFAKYQNLDLFARNVLYVTYKRKIESLRLFATRGNAASIKGSISIGRGTLRSDRKREDKGSPLLLWGYQTMARTIPTQSAIVHWPLFFSFFFLDHSFAFHPNNGGLTILTS